jgi:chromosomal replication initiation ATPase DnaA
VSPAEVKALIAQREDARQRLLEEREDLQSRINAIDQALTMHNFAPHAPSVPSDKPGLRQRPRLSVEEVGRPGLPINSGDVLHATALFYGFTVAAVKGESRFSTVALVRHVGMHLSRTLTRESTPEIGRTFGGRDHTTVISACQKVEELLRVDEGLRGEVEVLESVLRKAMALRFQSVQDKESPK